MKKLLIGVLLIGVVVIFLFIQQYSRTNVPTNVTTPSKTIQSDLQGNIEQATDRYLSYDARTFAKKSNKKRVLYFHADWCPICRPIDEEFTEKMNQIPNDIVVFKTNYDTETELKTTYAITYQHTFVQVDSNGNEVTRWNGGGLTQLINRIQ